MSLLKVDLIRKSVSSFGAVYPNSFKSAGHQIEKNLKVRFFSDSRVSLRRELTVRRLWALDFQLVCRNLIGKVKEIVELESAHKEDEKINKEVEMRAHEMKSKFFAIEKHALFLADQEIDKLDDVIMLLASKPEWIDKDELKEIMCELRPTISTLIHSIELIRQEGAVYLDGGDLLKEFLQQNRVSEYAAEVKSGIGRLSIRIKKNIPYLSSLLKTVQRKWSWLDDEEKELFIAYLKKTNEKKKKVAKERKVERKRQDKITKRYLESFKKSFKS